MTKEHDHFQRLTESVKRNDAHHEAIQNVILAVEALDRSTPNDVEELLADFIITLLEAGVAPATLRTSLGEFADESAYSNFNIVETMYEAAGRAGHATYTDGWEPVGEFIPTLLTPFLSAGGEA